MKAKKQFLSLLLCGAMLFSLCPQVALAEATQNGGAAGGLCEHHPQHTAECGYTEGSEGAPCTFTCKICNPQDSGEVEETEPEAECICTGLCTQETANAECPVCGAGGADLTACAGAEAEIAALSNALAARVLYLDEKGTTQYTPEDAAVTEIESNMSRLDQGWYVVNGAVNNPYDSIDVSGDVHLILADGCTFDARNDIQVSQNGHLTIYAQSTGGQMGQLTSKKYGINCEGGQITINGGFVSATCDAGDAGINCEGGQITINGGNVTASSYNGPGIGCSSSSLDGTITINGGTVTATGGNNSAGIGCGSNRSGGSINVTINGGTVTATATSESNAAGIGGGYYMTEGSINVTINGGTVTATGGKDSAGIGGESNMYGGSIGVTINGGTVTATGGKNGAGIGRGLAGAGNHTFSTGEGGHAVIFAKGGGEADAAISDESGKGNWSGILFEGTTGQVYGNQTLTEDFTIPENYELTIPQDVTLTILEDVTLTNKGTITVEADGGLTNNGTILMEGGTIMGDVGGNTPGYPTSVSVSAEPAPATFEGTVTLTATVTYDDNPVSAGAVTFYQGEVNDDNKLRRYPGQTGTGKNRPV